MPRPPSPPALLTAAASAGVDSQPMGDCRIGHLSPSRSVKAFFDHMVSLSDLSPVTSRASSVIRCGAGANDAIAWDRKTQLRVGFSLVKTLKVIGLGRLVGHADRH